MGHQDKRPYRMVLRIALLLCMGGLITSSYNNQTETALISTRQPPEEARHRGSSAGHATGSQRYRVEESTSPYEIDHYKELLVRAKKSRAIAGCSQLKELNSTFLCLFPQRQDMHLSLYRASAYIEKGRVMLTDNQVRQDIGFDGHDFMREDLLRYHKAFEKFKQETVEGHIAQETSFWNTFLLQKLQTHADLILIAAFDAPYMDIVISHELLHAQFFSNPIYQQTVSDFWNTRVPEAARRAVRHRLAEIYPTIEASNLPVRTAAKHQHARRVLLNEFQAYTLQIPEGENLQGLLDLTAPYRKGLRQYLVDCNVPPIRFGANSTLPPKSSGAKPCHLPTDSRTPHRDDNTVFTSR